MGKVSKQVNSLQCKEYAIARISECKTNQLLFLLQIVIPLNYNAKNLIIVLIAVSLKKIQ